MTRSLAGSRQIAQSRRLRTDPPPGPAPAQSQAPVVSSVSVSASSTQASVSATTDQAAIAWVEYGTLATPTGGPYPSESVHETNPSTSHVLTVTGLTAVTSYRYRVKAVNSYGLAGYSAEGIFATSTAPTIVGYGANALTGLGTRVSTVTDTASFLTAFAALGSTVDVIRFGAGAITIDLGPQIRQLSGRSSFLIDGRGANVTFINGTGWFENCHHFCVINVRHRGGWSSGQNSDNWTIAGGSHDYAFVNCSASGSYDEGISSTRGCYNYTLQDCLFGPGESKAASVLWWYDMSGPTSPWVYENHNYGSLNYGGTAFVNGPASFIRSAWVAKSYRNPKCAYHGDGSGQTPNDPNPNGADPNAITYDVVNNVAVECGYPLTAELGAKVNNTNAYNSGNTNPASAWTGAVISTTGAYPVAAYAQVTALTSDAGRAYAKANAGVTPRDAFDTTLLARIP